MPEMDRRMLLTSHGKMATKRLKSTEAVGCVRNFFQSVLLMECFLAENYQNGNKPGNNSQAQTEFLLDFCFQNQKFCFSARGINFFD